MSTIDTNPVMIIDTKRDFKVWLISEIFVPGGAGGRYVPNINNEIVEWTDNSYRRYRVTDVDYTTGKSTWQLMHEVPYTPPEGVEDVILSSSPGNPIEAYRAYIDRSVKPATISIDRHFVFLGTMTRYAKIFKGTQTGPNGQVISAMYDGDTLLGENIPLRQVATWRVPTLGPAVPVESAVKIVEHGYLTADVVDNELLTVVAYDDAGNVVQQRTVVAYNTSWALQPDTSKRYVREVRLKSQFLSEGDDTTVLVPRNMTLESILTMGEVLYSDGSVKPYPIDGTKMAIHGLYNNRYIANSDGNRSKIVLMYRLDPNEYLYGAQVGEFPHRSVPYWIETTPFEKAFAARIWACPQWVDSNTGYRMRYFLSTLSRDQIYDITDKVRLGPSSPAFDPASYGTTQNLILTVDMNLVNPTFKSFKFVQPTTITLFAPASAGEETSYSVNYAPGGATIFGLKLRVNGDYRSAGSWMFDVSFGAGSREDWLDRVFFSAVPLFNPTSETRSPAPTHFNLVCDGVSKEFSTDSWAQPLQMLVDPIPGEQVRFEWILRDGNGDHLLGVTAVPMFQVD